MGGPGSGRFKSRKRDSSKSRTNAARDQVTLDDEIKQELKAAKGKLARALSAHGTDWLIKIIDEGPSRWTVNEYGERVLVQGNADFTWAMNFAADRAGMPRRSEAEITQPGGFAIVVHDERGGLGWPGVAVGGGDRDDERSPLVAQ